MALDLEGVQALDLEWEMCHQERYWEKGAREVLGERRSVIIIVRPTIMWCTLWIDNGGSFWVGHKGRKCMFG